MKKILFTLSTLVIVISLCFIACNKLSETSPIETVERNDVKNVFGNFTPYSVSYLENNTRVDINFLESPVVFTLSLKERGSSASLNIIKTAIELRNPVELILYKDAIYDGKYEVAGIKILSDDIIEKFKKEKVSAGEPALLSKESDIVPMPNETVMNNVFNLCKNDPDQSFSFKPDGCYARAHKMMAIISQNGYMSGKQFIYGNLSVDVGSGCCQKWGYHVAPLIRFKNAANVIEVRIFDPSVSNIPLTKEQWFAICTNPCRPGAGIVQYFLARPEVYNRDIYGNVSYDNSFSKTFCTLNVYRPYSGGCFVTLPAGACTW